MHASGRHADAVAHHAGALALATEIGDREQTARACAGSGLAHRATGDPQRARECLRRALALYAELDAPEADDVREHLAMLSPTGCGGARSPAGPGRGPRSG